MSLLRSLLALFLLTLACRSEAAPDYEDMWWLPSESGWGLKVQHQGDTIFALLFHFAPDREAQWWLLSNAPRGTNETFTGALFAGEGPPVFTNFVPAQVTGRQVGTMSLRFASRTQLVLTYTIDGQTTSKTLERYTFKPLGVEGTYIGTQTAFISCSSNPTPGNYVIPATLVIGGPPIVRTTLSNTPLNTGPATCDWTGGLLQTGKMISGQGTLSCRLNLNNALIITGNWTVEDLRLVDRSFVGNMVLNTSYPTAGNATCTERGMISGTRQ